ncbi:unnamed protein product [Zymoseptoria tritici ST99CH_1A5]|uniref:RRM domain-containing protein n=1 Tax=Zymoseptoria tritici ST99CH_1A5 TaxID=1276529 RepID=A0A1Y6LGQ9_ZYMTR|nr:unnamed protein product [Zymoseptoria tritici ST99CH_1A5]
MASITRPIANRALHLRTHPRPTNLGESREILRLISEFGEVEYFRNLKYDVLSHPEAALVIFKNEQDAHKCLKTCPIRFRLDAAPTGEAASSPTPANSTPAAASQPPQPTTSHTHSEAPAPRTGPFGLPLNTRSYSTRTYLPTPPPPRQQTPFEPPQPLHPIPPSSRIYQIIASPARNHFRDHINTGPYYGNFNLDTTGAPQQELVKIVPVKGLSCVDWRKEDRLWKVARRERENEKEGEGRRRTLREIWEEGRG